MSRRENERISADDDDRATDLHSGAQVWRSDRDQLTYALGGRRIDLYVEADERGMTIWFPDAPTWDDGASLTPDDVVAAQDTIRAVADARHRRWTIR